MAAPVLLQSQRACRPVVLARASTQGRPSKPVEGGDAENVTAFSRRWLPQLLAEQERAARSGNELSRIVQWADELGSKAEAALADLQQSVETLPALLGDGGAAEADGRTNGNGHSNGAAAAAAAPAAAAPDVDAALARLDGVAASIRASNARFAREFAEASPDGALRAPAPPAAPAAAGGGGGSGSASDGEGGEAAVRSRQEYLLEFMASMEAAEERMRQEEAARAAAAEAAAAAAAHAAAEAEAAAEAAARAAAAAAAEAAGGSTDDDEEEAPGPAAPRRPVALEFAVRCCTQPGQDVALVGSHPALGLWDVDAALPLAWSEGHIWRGELEVDGAEWERVEFKAVLRCGGGAVVWQGGPNCEAELGPGVAGLSLYQEFAPDAPSPGW
ncbi:hypothetical protein Rsub_06604 [Raphidocelis subcapitata]|uniref:CBM20 domain-containing protein n=1 Tax=Raphidocelis subcapitata TaxID=307507 RepID=A0A2V0P0S1_9CHLO|nr:hypothetical protein Rsub_06604 [Raphidocelis subcapitata]|eukprot:GBF93471.1 hypothetical protein Rsub_06604 [Raphidocelis subcapitata]